MNLQRALLVAGPLAIGALAGVLLVLLYTYLFVFGTILGLNVSSLDSDGPQWPFAIAWILGTIALVMIPVGSVWAWVFSRYYLRRGGRHLNPAL